ncbi:unknown [Clostridium sp. CAG:264]|nr:unknown [Clostridium sp. CAG:264]
MKQTIEKHPVIFIMIGFLIIILIGLLFSSLFRKKDENRKETVTTTEVITTELSETSENQAEVETTTEQMSVNADNYIQTLSEIIVEHFDGLPVTEDLKDKYSNEYFNAADVVKISPISDMCNFNEHTACFDITTADGVVDSYGISFTVVNGQINYINIYYVPSGAEGGI